MMDIEKVIGHPLQLLEVVVEKISCRHTDLDTELENESIHKLQIKVSTKAKIVKDDRAYGYLILKLTDDSSPPLTSIEVVLKGTFVADEENRKKLKGFIETQSFPILLPWARELISDLSTRMGMAPVLIPVINVLDTVRANNQEAKE